MVFSSSTSKPRQRVNASIVPRCYPVVGHSLTYFTPTTNNAMRIVSTPARVHVLSSSTLSVFIALFGFLAFVEHPKWMDPLSGLLLLMGMFLSLNYV